MNTLPSYPAQAAATAFVQPGASPATMRIGLEISPGNVLPVNLCEIGRNNRSRLLGILGKLDNTATGRALLDELRNLAQAGAISTLLWHADGKTPPIGGWHFWPEPTGYDPVLSKDTDLRRHAARIFPDLVNARNALAQAQRWGGEPLDPRAMMPVLAKELRALRETDAPTQDFNGLLTAQVAHDLRGSTLVLRALRAIEPLPAGQALLRELAALRDLGAIPLVDYNWDRPDGPYAPIEADGTPIWVLHENDDSAEILRQLANVRDALARAAPSIGAGAIVADEVTRRLSAARLRGQGNTLAYVDAGKAGTVRRDDMDGLLTVDMTGAADDIRADVVADLREITRHDSGGRLLELLQALAGKGYVPLLHAGPASSAADLDGRLTWIYNAADLEQRGLDPNLPAATARTCAVFWDLMTLHNAAVRRAFPAQVPMSVNMATHRYHDEVLESERIARRRNGHAMTGPYPLYAPELRWA